MDHPIENIMRTTMESLKDMIDVNTVVGDAVETEDGTIIIPISRVSAGFVSGGGEYDCKTDAGTAAYASQSRMPFAGGAGACISLCPMGFLVVGQNGVRMLPAHVHTAVDRVIEMAPQLVCELKKILCPTKPDSGTHADCSCPKPEFPQTYSSYAPDPVPPIPPQSSATQAQPNQSTTNSEL